MNEGSQTAPSSRERPWFEDYEPLKSVALLASPIWIFDVDRHRIWWSNGSELKFWKAESLEDLLRRDFSDDSEIVRTRLRQIIDNTNPTDRVQETWTIYPRGKPTTVIFDFKPILISRDRRNAVLIETSFPIAADGDPEALRILEAARNTPLLVSTFSLEGDLLVANPAATLCYSRRGNDNGAELARRFIDPDDVAAILERVRDNQPFQSDCRVLTASGEEIHRLAARHGRDPISGEVTIVITEEDITDRARLEEELARMNSELEARVAQRTGELQALIDAIPMPVSFQDREGSYVNCNDAFIALLGADAREKVLGRKPGALWPETEARQIERGDQALLGGGGPQQRPIEVVAPDGSLQEYISSEAVFLDSSSDPAGIVRIMLNMTERKRAEERLRQAQKMEAVGQLTGGLAHDFNNLLTVVLGNLEIMGDSFEEESQLMEVLTRAIGAVERGSSLTQQMLAFARQQPLAPRSVDINQLVRDMTGLLQRTLGRDIRIVETLSPDLGHAEVDPAQLQNALVNLALNARDAMKSGGVIEVATARRRLTEADLDDDEDALPGDYAMLSVRDEGSGMTADVAARVFEPFFTTKELTDGSGLGLSMVFGFVKQSKGHIALESAPGKGTEVRLYLPPIAQGEVAAVPVDQPLSTQESLETILVVEDDQDVRSYVTTVLSKAGYRVLEAADGHSAMAVLKQGVDIDLLLADVMLPGGISGRDVADTASQLLPAMKVLFTSGYSKDQIIQDGRLEAGVELLQKPYRRQVLLQTLRQLLDRK